MSNKSRRSSCQTRLGMHRIFGYLFYKTDRFVRRTSMGIFPWYATGVISLALTLYVLDACLIYAAATSGNPLPFFKLSMPIVWFAPQIYYYYRIRYLKIRQDKSHEKYSSVWAILFLLFPFVFLIVFALIMPY